MLALLKRSCVGNLAPTANILRWVTALDLEVKLDCAYMRLNCALVRLNCALVKLNCLCQKFMKRIFMVIRDWNGNCFV